MIADVSAGKENDVRRNQAFIGPEVIARLRKQARFLRRESLRLNNRTLHAGAALSSADIVACLFYHVLNIRPYDPKWAERDIFINSRGHACEPIYVAMADLGFFSKSDLASVEDLGSHLHGLSAITTPGIEFSTGALGTGLSLGVGAALALRIDKRPGRIFIVTGDGELQEGLFWESAMAASHYQLDKMVLIVDRNGYQSNERGTEVVMSLEPLQKRLESFGFAVRRVNGNDCEALVNALASLPLTPGKPSAIIADTVKGQGVSFLESRRVHCGRFGRDFDLQLQDQALGELEDHDK